MTGQFVPASVLHTGGDGVGMEGSTASCSTSSSSSSEMATSRSGTTTTTCAHDANKCEACDCQNASPCSCADTVPLIGHSSVCANSGRQHCEDSDHAQPLASLSMHRLSERSSTMQMHSPLQNYNTTSAPLAACDAIASEDAIIPGFAAETAADSALLTATATAADSTSQPSEDASLHENGAFEQIAVASSGEASRTGMSVCDDATGSAELSFPNQPPADREDPSPETPGRSSAADALRSKMTKSAQGKASRSWCRVTSMEQRSPRRTEWCAHRERVGSPSPRGLKAAILREDERRRRTASRPNDIASEAGPSNGHSLGRNKFQLQPAPLPMKRKVQRENSIEGVSQNNAAKRSRQSEGSSAVCSVTAADVSVGVDGCSSLASQVPQGKECDAETTSPAPARSVQSNVSALVQPFSGSRGETATLTIYDAADEPSRGRSSRAQGQAQATATKEPSALRHVAGPSRLRSGELRRSRSVPQLKARQDLNLMKPAKHHVDLPSSYVRFPAEMGLRLPKRLVAAESSKSRLRDERVSHSRPAVCIPPYVPPITRATLRELDLHEIVKNPQLRHDVVFDAHVQFRPNFDGERGRRKREACERYWAAISREIETGCVCTTFDGNKLLPCSCQSGGRGPNGGDGRVRRSNALPSRLPTLIMELRAICLSVLPGPENSLTPTTATGSPSLVSASVLSGHSNSSLSFSLGGSSRAIKIPTTFFSGPSTTSSSHYASLVSGLDPTLISQQLQHGVLNVSELVQFVASILKMHCAPMRDEMIEQMVTAAKRGEVGQCLRMCFEILELMKLDIANHQLRSTRPWLVNTAMEFESRWFREQVAAGKMGNLEKTVGWMRSGFAGLDTAETISKNARQRMTVMNQVFNAGFMKLVFELPTALSFSGASDSMPPTPHTATTPMSSSSLNYTYSMSFPETFQFDAYRIITFHNEVVDLCVVYMILLLFRQLACSPAIAAPGVSAGARTAAVVSKASGLAQKQLESVKAEVWCLLNEANVAVSASASTSRDGAASPRTPTALSGGGGAMGPSTGMGKLKDPRWIQGMKSVLVSVAARAGAVWDEAHHSICVLGGVGSSRSDDGPALTRVPNAKTMALLESWSANQLSPESALMKMCISKLKGVLGSHVSRKIAAPVKASKKAAAAAADGEPTSSPCQKRASTEMADEGQPSAKRTKIDSHESRSDEDEDEDDDDEAMDADTPTLPIRSSCASIAALSDRVIHPCGSPRKASASAAKRISDSDASEDWDQLVTKAGLDTLKVELRSLGARLAQVACMNIKTFGSLYENILFPAAARGA